MDKLTKTIFLFTAEILLVTFFLGFSEKSVIGATILFPIAFAVTFYFIVLNIFEINFGNKKYDYLMALFIGGLALFATGVGYHYSTNEIDIMLLSSIDGGSIDAIQKQINFMDEYFSHWIILGGLLIIMLAILVWYKVSHEDIRKYKEADTKLLDTFFISFGGTITGTMAGFLSIEAKIIKYGLLITSFLVPITLIKFKEIKLTKRGFELVLYVVISLSSYIAVLLAYYFIFKTKFIITPFM